MREAGHNPAANAKGERNMKNYKVIIFAVAMNVEQTVSKPRESSPKSLHVFLGGKVCQYDGYLQFDVDWRSTNRYNV